MSKKVKIPVDFSLKEQRFLKEYLQNGGNRSKAVIDAGYNIGSRGGKETNKLSIASTIGSNILKRMSQDKTVKDILVEKGITAEAIIDKFKTLLESKDQRVVYQIMDMYFKLVSAYPDTKLRIGKLEEIQDVITETDVETASSPELNVIESSSENSAIPE